MAWGVELVRASRLSMVSGIPYVSDLVRLRLRWLDQGGLLRDHQGDPSLRVAGLSMIEKVTRRFQPAAAGDNAGTLTDN